MPNHIHGIIVIVSDRGGTNDVGTVAATDGVGAGLANMPSDLTDDPSAKPAPTNPMDLTDDLSAKPAPTLAHAPIISKYHGIPEIVRGFKTFSARRINKIRRTAGIPVWQRNYYEHIIRDEQAWQNVRQYIFVNPAVWQEDRLFSEQ
ncbi:MAG: hypothetical protein HC827_19425 [Cyanobacteria bacterium RM1_2_2]|nr:hypothetical protein [Cyanobacteria bacterium RM1_2_2]